MTTTQSIAKRLKEDTEYQKFFRSAMNKFGVDSPKELSRDKKKEFFNYVDKNYSAKNEGKLNEAYFPVHSADGPQLKKAKQALANWFKNSIEMGMQNRPLGRKTFDILNDLIEDYVEAYNDEFI